MKPLNFQLINTPILILHLFDLSQYMKVTLPTRSPENFCLCHNGVPSGGFSMRRLGSQNPNRRKLKFELLQFLESY
jgi:hypothetical protein